MRLTAKIDGAEHKSIDKPKMKHIRMGGKLLDMQAKSEDNPKIMYDYIEEIYSYIKDTFLDVCDEQIDSLSTEEFMALVTKISKWANGGYDGEQKKN